MTAADRIGPGAGRQAGSRAGLRAGLRENPGPGLTRRHLIAVTVAVAVVALALVGPLWLRSTGERAFLRVAPVDPRALFRGNYVDLDYPLDGIKPRSDRDWGSTVFVVFEAGRPARPLRVESRQPDVGPGQFCVAGRYEGEVRFDTLEQFFVPEDQALELERSLGSKLAEIAVDDDCDAVLIGLVDE